MKILFCRIGWMENYRGQTESDHIHGGGSFVKENGMGHEVCNFSPDEHGYLYGYVQPNSETINLKRLDINSDGISVSDVTVVWVATHHIQKKSLGAKIVGWYRNATVFSEFQQFQPVPKIQEENGLRHYIIKAPVDQAVLLPIDARVQVVPRAQDKKGFFGQSNVWYADSENEEVQNFVQEVIQYITKYDDKKNSGSLKKIIRIQDQDKKVKVERAAIETVIMHFQELGYTIYSVEKDNFGWDLEASAEKTILRIEVKGLSGKDFNIGLTPNEYKSFEKKQHDYRLAVVTNVLNQPKLFVCRFSPEANAWLAETEGNNPLKLNIETKTSAMVSCLLPLD